MAKKAEKKTNAMRILDTAGTAYRVLAYSYGEDDFDGLHVAEQLELSPEVVFKTLVTRGPKGQIAVCCIPVASQLDLKALAASAGVKSLELVPVGELLSLTGYVRGGCSPVGMKKSYPTYIDESAHTHSEIAVSAGIRGKQIFLAPKDLISAVQAQTGRFTSQAQL